MNYKKGVRGASCLVDVNELEEVDEDAEDVAGEEGEHDAEQHEHEVPLLLHLLPRPEPVCQIRSP
jgi:hypothetical protein